MAMTPTREPQIARRLQFREETNNSEEHQSPPADGKPDVRELNQHFETL